MPEPDTTLRAVEIAATIGGVKRLTDGSISIYIKSALEFSKAESWPVSLLQGEPAKVLIEPENIGESADIVRPKGTKKSGSAGQAQRLIIEAIGEANGVAPEKIESYYQSRMNSNMARLQKELERAQQKEF